MWQAISQQLSATLMFEYCITEKSKISGGDISQSYMINDGFQRYFVKINDRSFLTKFETEAESLHLLRESSSLFVPEVVLVSNTKTHAFIILNYLPTRPLDDSRHSFQFGQKLARLHLWGEQKEFGFDCDNYLGSTLQPNQWHKKWSVFFAEQRIGWQLQLLKEKGVILVDVGDFVSFARQSLVNHFPTPSLLHGNLWSGNTTLSPAGPLCFDPACYWGDRECDIAMTELFGGFQSDFYTGYQSVAPLAEGYKQRRDLYNLYHILNHCNLFGGHYFEQAESLIKKILSQ
ncbi:hypothetical protein BS333_06680 [Vibrio azureus]|uniref:Fructosamine kinase family protein n=1 Tax=Vibrio azureus NBRC 104587 TaxID=1219077 RepID=U3A3Q8_9VIBR|nr:fructosamine kinase family protein [Vibrio azureus]AUI86093.1 hypothetical protein BS333_06680 [Vibrio azureus]GAD74646.1 hypothetical protein VAZ01S_013_00530 [Vibrio azureus NBRC 104587]